MKPESIENIRTILEYVSETNYQEAAAKYAKTHKSMKNFRCPMNADQQFLLVLLEQAFVLSDDLAVELSKAWLHRGFHNEVMDYLRYIATDGHFPTKEELYSCYQPSQEA